MIACVPLSVLPIIIHSFYHNYLESQHYTSLMPCLAGLSCHINFDNWYVTAPYFAEFCVAEKHVYAV